VHRVDGPGGARLLLVERALRIDGGANSPWRVQVAADLQETAAAVRAFDGVLGVSLALLVGLLAGAAALQVRVGLAPLRALQQGLLAVREGRAQRLPGRHPREVQPLVDDFNAVLDRNAEVVERARTQAGDLAHAVKTPLAALAQGAEAARARPQALAELPALVDEQVALARRHVDWHLSRARAAAARALPGARAEVAPVVAGLVRVVQRVHAERAVRIDVAPMAPQLAFAGEAQDLQEMVGNLLDNACQWARGVVRVEAARIGDGTEAPRLCIVVQDDGPGIEPAQRERALARGGRLDESTPGHGLGLAIVRDRVAQYGGAMRLDEAAGGGLRAALELPAAPP
jgi:signal transduction histidine kinase